MQTQKKILKKKIKKTKKNEKKIKNEKNEKIKFTFQKRKKQEKKFEKNENFKFISENILNFNISWISVYLIIL